MLQGGASNEISSSSDVHPSIDYRESPCSPVYLPPLSDSDGVSDAEISEVDPDIELVEVPYLSRSGNKEPQVCFGCNLVLQAVSYFIVAGA